MSIPLTGTGGLFTRLGKLGRILYDINQFQGTTLPTDLANLLAQYTTDEDLIEGIAAQQTGAQGAAQGIMGFLQNVAQNTVTKMVYLDNPQSSRNDLQVSLKEVIRQMKAGSQTVQAATVGGSVSSSGNQGNGVCVVGLTGTDGRALENAFAETIMVTCTADSTAGRTAGAEGFTATGTVPASSPFSYTFPAGSGATATLAAINATTDLANGQLLRNGDFEAFASNVPGQWSISVGTAGTTVFQTVAAGTFYSGTSALQFTGNGSELTAVSQQFGSTALKPNTVYAANCMIKVNSVPAAGVLRVALVDGTGAVINNDQGGANSFNVNLTTATTSFASYSGMFVTPHVLPAVAKFKLSLTTALSTGVQLYMDHVGLGLATKAYQGGPYLAVFSGANNFYNGDRFSVAVTNDRGGSSGGRSFQVLCDRLFNTRQMGLLLPSSPSSPSLADTLIA